MPKRIIAAAIVASCMLAAPVFAAEPIHYLIDWYPSGEESYVYVGVQEGFFKAEGLDVTVGIAKGGSDAITRVATGGADFTNTGLPALLLAQAQGKVPVKAVLSIYTKQPDAIFTVEGSGITSLKDLAGHKLATATFSSSNPTWPVVAAASGLKPDSVALLKVDFNTLAPMLATGGVPATINWVTAAPATASILSEAGKKLVVLPWSQYGLTGYSLTLLASEKLIVEKPDTVRRFVAAFAKSVAFVAANPEKSAQDLRAMVPDADLADAVGEIKAATPLIHNEISGKDGVGALEPGLVKQTWEWVAKAQNLPPDGYNPEAAVDRSFVPKS